MLCMTLLRSKSVTVGTVLAFTGVKAEEDGQTFLHGTAAEFNLDRGDVVKIIDIDKERQGDTPWAKVTVACLKGKFVGRVGVVSIDLSTRYQRSWQSLTHTGSMVAVRAPKSARKATGYSIVVGRNTDQEAETTPAPTAEVNRGGKKSSKQVA